MWIRKLSSLFLVCIVICSCFSVRAYADQIYDPWVDIAKVCTVNNSGTNYFAFNGKTTVSLNPGFSTIVSQIDMIWFCGYGAPSSVYLWRNNNSSSRLQLTVQHIGGSYYRIYGNVGNYTLSEYKFDIDTGTTAYRSYEIKTCRITESVATYGIDPSFTVDTSDNSSIEYYSNGVYLREFSDTAYPMTARYSWEIYTDDWKAYDYIDVQISTERASIGSIMVMHSGRALPFEVTYLYTENGMISNSDNTYTDVPYQPSLSAIIHIDTSSISRTSAVPPRIFIEGYWNTSVGAHLQVPSCIGYIKPVDRVGVSYWFEKAKAFLSSVLDPVTDVADDFVDDAVDRADQMNDLNSQLQESYKPDLGDVSVDASLYLDTGGKQTFTSVMGAFASNNLLVTMMTITLTVALLGFILYGKR